MSSAKKPASKPRSRTTVRTRSHDDDSDASSKKRSVDPVDDAPAPVDAPVDDAPEQPTNEPIAFNQANAVEAYQAYVRSVFLPSGGFGSTVPSGGFGSAPPSGGFGSTVPSGGFGSAPPSGGFGFNIPAWRDEPSPADGGFGSAPTAPPAPVDQPPASVIDLANQSEVFKPPLGAVYDSSVVPPNLSVVTTELGKLSSADVKDVVMNGSQLLKDRKKYHNDRLDRTVMNTTFEMKRIRPYGVTITTEHNGSTSIKFQRRSNANPRDAYEITFIDLCECKSYMQTFDTRAQALDCLRYSSLLRNISMRKRKNEDEATVNEKLANKIVEISGMYLIHIEAIAELDTL
jgi:hypothetical protein